MLAGTLHAPRVYRERHDRARPLKQRRGNLIYRHGRHYIR